MTGEKSRATWRRRGVSLLVAGFLSVFPAAVGAAESAGSLLLVWRQAPPAGVARHELTPAAAGLAAQSLTRLVPLFPGHTAPDDPLARFWRADLAPAADGERVRDRLRRDPRFETVETDRVVPLSGTLPDDPFFVHLSADSTQWPLRNPAGPDLRAIDAWNVTTGDSTIVIGHIDSGTDWHHPEFRSEAGPGGTIVSNDREARGLAGVDDDDNGFVDDLRGWDFVDVTLIPGETRRADPLEDSVAPDNDPNDYEGHGTFVAGIMSARMDDGRGIAGVAPGCRLMPLRAGWRQDYTDPFTGQRIVRGVISMIFCAQAIVYAADNGVRVLNCSWESDSTAALKAALDYAIGVKGLVVVNAATNGGLSETQIRNYLSRRGDCIEVCAVDRRGFIVPQSSVGRWVDLSAPGEGIISLAPASFGRGYSVFGGATSWAAPHVAGAAALLLSAEPGLNWQEVKQRLKDTATNLDAQNGIYGGKIGSGMVQAAAALRAAELNPAAALASVPATPPAWLPDGSAVFTSAGGQLVRVAPRSAAVDSFPLFVTGRIGGVAYGPVGAIPTLALTFGRGQVGLNSIAGAALPGWPRPTGGLIPGGPVLTETGRLFVAGTDSLLYGWEGDGRLLPGFPVRLTDAALAAPAVGDIERDGTIEIVVITADGVLTLVQENGVVRTGWPRSTERSGRVSPLLGDLDGDGRLDIVVADVSGEIEAWSAAGVRLPGWPRSLGGALFGEPALADLDGDQRAEILAARSSRLYVLAGTGQDRRGWPVPLRDPPVGGPLVGRLVLGPPEQQVALGLASGCVVAFAADGSLLPDWPKRLTGPLDAPPALLPGGGPFDPFLVAITRSGRLETFRLPSLFQAGERGWGTLGGDPGRTRALRATAPLSPPGPDSDRGPRRLEFTPNPFLGGTRAVVELPRDGRVRVTWYTLAGRRIRSSDALADRGRYEIRWDGLDDQGRRVPAGVYHYRVESAAVVWSGRVIHLH